MCAEYNLKTSERELSVLLDVSILNQTNDQEWNRHVRLYGRAPVIYEHQGQVVIEEMQFSLLPPGSRISFSANTRLDDWDERKGLILAFERPLWREAFLRRRCVVPVSEFIEPIYIGMHEGQMMGFFDPDSPIIFIAGIYQETLDVKTGEIFKGFSVLTDFAHPFVQATGHHRTVITLPPQAALEWIKARPIEGRWGIEFLMRNKDQLNLDTHPVRTMKNWKSRVATSIEKARHEEHVRPRIEAARQDWIAKNSK